MNRDDARPDALEGARLGVLAAASEGDAGVAFDIINGLLSEGVSYESVLFDLIAPLQAEVGKRWWQGDFGIAEEHASTSTIETIVALLAGSLATPEDAPHVVVACAEGDNHSLPARMIAAYLLYLGWRVTFLGTSVPADDLGEYLAELKPEALLLSCAIATRLPGARACVRASHAAGVPVLAGGRGFGVDDSLARAIGADAWAATPQDIDGILRSWHPTPDVLEAAAADPDAELATIETRRLEILNAAVTEVAVQVDTARGDERARVRADMALLLDAARAAVLVQDPSIVGDFAAWRHELRASRDTALVETPVVLAALRNALTPIAPTAARYLDEAAAALGS